MCKNKLYKRLPRDKATWFEICACTKGILVLLILWFNHGESSQKSSKVARRIQPLHIINNNNTNNNNKFNTTKQWLQNVK